jgi:hypothetical protein
MKQSNSLNNEEKMEFIIYMAQSVKQIHKNKTHRKWSDIRGAIPYSALGEDAQEWVSRTRREADEHRQLAYREEAVANEN